MPAQGKLDIKYFLLLVSLFFIYFPIHALGYSANTAVYFLGVLILGWSIIQLKNEYSLNSESFSKKITTIFKYCFWIFYLTILSLALCSYIFKYFNLQYELFDLGFHGASIFNLIDRGSLYNSILEKHYLADHFSPAFLIFTPFFSIYPSVVWILLLQITAFFAVPLCLLRIGKLFKLPSSLIYIAPTGFLLCGLNYDHLFWHTQANSLVLPVMLLSIIFCLQKRTLLFPLSLLSILLFKEDFGFIVIALGVFYLVMPVFSSNEDVFGFRNKFKERVWKALLIIGLGISSGLFIYFIVMPFGFNQGEMPMQAGRLGIFALLADKALLPIVVILTASFMPLLAPQTLLYVLPCFGIAFFANSKDMVSFTHHYQAIPLTMSFVAMMHGLSFVKRFRIFNASKSTFTLLVGLVAFISLGFIYPHTGSLMTNYKRGHISTEQDMARFQELDEVKASLQTKKFSVTNFWTGSTVGSYLIGLSPLRSLRYSSFNGSQIGARDIVLFTKSSYEESFNENSLDKLSYREFDKMKEHGIFECTSNYKYLSLCYTQALKQDLEKL